MMNLLRLTLLLAILSANIAGAAADDIPRVAVLEVGPSGQVPAAFLDMLSVKISQQDDLALLERAEVERLLQEQEMALFAGTEHAEISATSAVATGRLLGVDLFLLLEAGGEGPARELRARFVDTRFGFKLDDIRLPMPSAEQFDSSSAQLTARVRSLLSRVTKDTLDMSIVGVLAFRNIEPSGEGDHLADEMRAGIENQLMIRTGIIVAERQRTRPISDERELVSEIPKALRTSLMVISGEYRISDDDPEYLVVDFQGRRNDVQVFRERVEGPRSDLRAINSAIADIVVKCLGELARPRSMSARLEAEMLIEQSNAAPDFASAIGAIEAAIALVPDEDEYRIHYLRRVARQSSSRQRLKEMPDPVGGGLHSISIQLLRRYVAMAEPLFDRWLRKPMLVQPSEFSNVLQHIPVMLYYIDPDKRSRADVRDLMDGRIRPMVERIRTVHLPHDLDDIGNRQRLLSIIIGIYQYIGAGSVEDAHELLRFALAHMDAESMLRLNNRPIWPAYLNVEQKLELDQHLFEFMLEHERDEVRLVGQRGLVHLYAAWDKGEFDLARHHYEKFESDYLDNFLPRLNERNNRPLFHGGWILPFLNTRGRTRTADTTVQVYRFYEDRAEDIKYHAERAARVFEEVANHPYHLLHGSWLFSGGDVAVFEQAGKIETADHILELYIKRMQEVVADHPRERAIRIVRDRITGLQRARERLHERHPQLAEQSEEEEPAESIWRASRLFSFNETVASMSGISERRSSRFLPQHLVMEHGMAAIVDSRGGVLFLDPQSLKPERFVEAPDGVSLRGRYAADDHGIYVVSADGIVFFPIEGEPQVFFQDHPDLSQRIRDIDVLDGSVYVVVGETGSNIIRGEALLQFDLKKDQRRILLSARAELGAVKNLDQIYHIATDPVNNWLCIKYRDSDGPAELAYDPETREFNRLPEFINPIATFYVHSRRRGNELLSWGTFGASYYDMEREEQLTRVASRARYDSYRAFARIDDGILGYVGGLGQLNYFPAGSREWHEIGDKVFPPPREGSEYVRDMCMHERGLIIMTTRALYAVTGIEDLIEAHFAEPTETDDKEGYSAEGYFDEWLALPMGPEKILPYWDYFFSRRYPHSRADFEIESALLSLEGLDLDQRRSCIFAFLKPVAYGSQTLHHPASRWISELRPEEWRDPEIQGAIAKLLTTEKNVRVQHSVMRELLRHMPADLELDHWVGQVDSAGGIRQTVMAAMLVKNGYTDLAQLLLSSTNEHGRAYLEFINLYKILAGYRFHHVQAELAVAAAATIEERGSGVDGRPNFQDLRHMSSLPESKEALAVFADSENRELALAVCFILVNDGRSEYLPQLEDLLAEADPEAIAEHRMEIYTLIRRFRAQAILNPEREPDYHSRILKLIDRLFASFDSEETSLEFALWRLADFIVDDLQAFGIYPDIPSRIIPIFLSLNRYCIYYDPLPRLAEALVNDAEHRDGLETLMTTRQESIAESGYSWGPRLLLMHIRSIVDHPDPLGMFDGALRPWGRRDDSPPVFIKKVWTKYPDEVLRMMPLEDLMGVVSIYSRQLGPELVQQILEELESGSDEEALTLFRMFHGLPVDRMPDWSFAERNGPRKIKKISGLDAQIVRDTDWTPYLLAAGDQIINERGYCPLSRLKNFLLGSARLYMKSPPTRESMVESSGISADFIRAAASLYKGDLENGLKVFDRYFDTGEWRPSSPRMAWYDSLKWRFDLSRGLYHDAIAEGQDEYSIFISDNSFYENLYMMIESGYPQITWDLIQTQHQHVKWDVCQYRRYAHSHLAWLAARMGDWDAAHEIAMVSLNNSATKHQSDYALMQVKLFADQPPALRDYVDILNLRPWKVRTEYAQKLTLFAESTHHPDLKALAAFQAGRIAYASGNLPDARRLWQIGAESSGLHSKYCRKALEGTSAQRTATKVTKGWNYHETAPSQLSPLSPGFGVTARAEQQDILLEDVVFLDPYGVPIESIRRQKLNRSHVGWWLYTRNRPLAWLHGEWTLVAPHADGIDVHHRTLVPCGGE